MAHTQRHPRIALDRIVAGLLLGLAFLVMASVFVPGSIHADNAVPGTLQPRTILGPLQSASIGAATDDIALGSIESKNLTARMISATDGTRFTIVENATGTVLGERLTGDLVKQLFPELAIDDMVTDPSRVLMTAERMD